MCTPHTNLTQSHILSVSIFVCKQYTKKQVHVSLALVLLQARLVIVNNPHLITILTHSFL